MDEPGAVREDSVFRAIIEGAPDGVVVLRWPSIVFINSAAAYCLGSRETEPLIGRSILDFLVPSEAALAEQRAGAALRGERRKAPIEYGGRDPEGNRLVVEVSARPIVYQGAPAMVAFVRDVTERRRLQNQVRQADRLAAVATLAAGVAHEINNPLGYLLLNVEAMLRDLPRLQGTPAQLRVMERRLRQCMQGGERVKTIVRDLQAFTRKREDSVGAVDLATVADAVLAMVQHKLPEGTELTRDFGQAPPVVGNETRLEQLVLNLVINAIHAVSRADAGSRRIALSLTTTVDDRVLLKVSDNGEGMTKEVLGQVFDPFFTTKPPGLGSGLGLAISDTIVRSFGGRIDVQSEPGKGTTVSVELPIAS